MIFTRKVMILRKGSRSTQSSATTTPFTKFLFEGPKHSTKDPKLEEDSKKK
jgi:hypothetical protein